MTRQEMTERFGIPERVLNDYEKNTCHDAEGYTDADIALLSQMVTLYEIGFSSQQAQRYLEAAVNGENAVRTALLEQKRQELLDTLHQQEEQLDKLDFLRYELKKTK